MSMNLDGYVQRKTELVFGTTKFMFTELTMGDLGLFRGEMQKKRNDFCQERRRRLIADAEQIGDIEPFELLKFVEKPLTEDDIEAEMESPEGFGFLVYLSLKHHYPECSLADAELIATPANAEKISEALMPDQKKKPKKKKTATH